MEAVIELRVLRVSTEPDSDDEGRTLGVELAFDPVTKCARGP
jgi:hypothetical protein